MVPLSHLHIGGTEIRGDQILPDCIGDRARISKEQERMSPGGFCTEKVDYLEKTMILFYCLSARASKGYFEYNAKKVILHLSKSWQMAPWFDSGCPSPKQVFFTQGKSIFWANYEFLQSEWLPLEQKS